MINGLTEIYGIIGHPVKHTFSPFMHNSAFRALGINAVYVPFEVKPENLKSAVLGLKDAGVRGFNVTIPHKENIIKFLDSLSEEAKFLGAVNTVVVENSRLIGFNTDGPGFIDSIKYDVKLNLRNKNIFIFGAGGAARAISFSISKEAPKRIILTDIDFKKACNLADNLSRKIGCEVAAIESDKKIVGELILNSDLLVNASSSGMHKDDPVLLEPKWFHKKLVIYDVIYNPLETKLLKAAKLKGIRASNGLKMLLRQGARAFEIWTNHKAPVIVMENALTKALKNK